MTATTLALLVAGAAPAAAAPLFGAVQQVEDADATDATLADMNADGVLDLVTVRRDIGIRLGDGTGGFALRADYVVATASGTIASTAIALATGDLSGDGCTDVAVLTTASPSGGQLVTMMGVRDEGECTGALQRGSAVTTGAITVLNGDVVIADVNRDGRQDVVAAGGISSNTTWLTRVYLNAGSDIGAVSWIGPTRNVRIAVGDVTGDGWPDIVGSSSTGLVRLVPQTPGGPALFASETALAQSLLTASTSPTPFTIADVTGDGAADIVGIGGDFAIAIVPGATTPGGPLGTPMNKTVEGYPTGVAIADVDHDGAVDIVATADDATLIATLRGPVTAATPATTVATGLTNITGPTVPIAGDLNGDGFADVGLSSWFGKTYAALAQPSGASTSVSSMTFNATTMGASDTIAQGVGISSTGPGDLRVLEAAIIGPDAGDFAVQSTTCTTATALALGEACGVTVTFAPQSGTAGTRTATLRVTTNAPGAPRLITLAGEALARPATPPASPSATNTPPPTLASASPTAVAGAPTPTRAALRGRGVSVAITARAAGRIAMTIRSRTGAVLCRTTVVAPGAGRVTATCILRNTRSGVRRGTRVQVELTSPGGDATATLRLQGA